MAKSGGEKGVGCACVQWAICTLLGPCKVGWADAVMRLDLLTLVVFSNVNDSTVPCGSCACKAAQARQHHQEWPLWGSAELFQERYPGSKAVFNPSENKENRLRWAFESLSEDLDSQFPFK